MCGKTTTSACACTYALRASTGMRLDTTHTRTHTEREKGICKKRISDAHQRQRLSESGQTATTTKQTPHDVSQPDHTSDKERDEKSNVSGDGIPCTLRYDSAEKNRTTARERARAREAQSTFRGK